MKHPHVEFIENVAKHTTCSFPLIFFLTHFYVTELGANHKILTKQENKFNLEIFM